MRIFISLGISTFFFFSVFGQMLPTVSEREKQISDLFDSLQTSSVDEKKRELNQKIIELFSSELENTESFSNSYSSLKYVGKIYSDDKRVKIYTWNYPLSDKTYGYGGFIQHKLKNTIKTIPLYIKTNSFLPPDNKRILSLDWYGALYYKIITVKYKKENYYVLLGWAGNNAVSDFKIIEILNFSQKGDAYFGKMVLKSKEKTQQRVILEYSAEAKVSLTYDEKLKKIVYDHLVPSEPVYTNIYSFYGPDFTYDAYVLKKGKWYLEENIDMKNKD